jgi:O-antigen/teichoic acid export membrane protein
MLVFPLVFLAIGQFLLGTLSIPSWLSYAMNKPEIALRANIWSLLVVGPATIVLTYKWGMLGAAFSSVLYALWQIMYFVPRFCARCLADSPWPWFRHAGPIATLGLLTYGLSWIGAWLTGEGMTVRGLIAAYVVGSCVFITLGWLMLGDEIKSIARSLLLSALAQFKGRTTS